MIPDTRGLGSVAAYDDGIEGNPIELIRSAGYAALAFAFELLRSPEARLGFGKLCLRALEISFARNALQRFFSILFRSKRGRFIKLIAA